MALRIVKGRVSDRPWSDVDKTALRNRLVKALEDGEEGASEAIREVYAVIRGESLEDAPSENWWGPHHEVTRDGEVVLNKNGLAAAAAALAGARADPSLTAEQKRKAARHLLRHYRELDMDPPESLLDLAGEDKGVDVMDYGLRYLAAPFEVKADVDRGVFEGYASYFGNKDSYGDVVEKGAFADTLKNDAHRVKVLWQHNPYQPIGKPLHMEEDSKGLYVRAKVAPTTLGKDVLVLLREGVINELSIGYVPVEDEWDDKEQVRRLKKIKLYEFSPVTWAANELAVITGVKAAPPVNVTIAWPDGLDAAKLASMIAEQLQPKREPTPSDDLADIVRRFALEAKKLREGL